MQERMNRKGLSDIVTTLLIVLLGLGAVVLIWTLGIKPILEKGTASIGIDTACMDLSVQATKCTKIGTPTSSVNVLYERGNKEVDYKISKLTFLFTMADGTTKSVETSVAGEIPNVLATLVKPVAIGVAPAPLSAAPAKVSVVPSLEDKDGSIKSCNAANAEVVNCN